MLYDPKWEVKAETKADPFKLETLISWLEKQPADSAYCYGDTGHCLLARYFLDQGFKTVAVGGSCATLDRKSHWLPRAFENIPLVREHTFGAALKFARELLPRV